MSPSRTALLRACFLLLCLVAGSRQLSIKEFVVPKAVEVGTDAELRCQYDLAEGDILAALYVKWWWTPEWAPSYDRRLLYQRLSGHAAESLHHGNISRIDIKDNDTIILMGVNPMDSGTYECEVCIINETRQHEKLIVYTKGTGPEVNYTILSNDTGVEDDVLLIECQAEDVAPLPDMTISLSGEKLKLSKHVEDGDQEGLFRIYANATVSAANVEESEIRCELFYETLEQPPYVDVETYIPTGRDAPPSTALPEEATQPESTHESLQNPSGGGIGLHYSWTLVILAAAVPHLRALCC